MHTEADGRVRLVFHRFDNEYFLAFVFNGLLVGHLVIACGKGLVTNTELKWHVEP